jgi:hypothetical protein
MSLDLNQFGQQCEQAPTSALGIQYAFIASKWLSKVAIQIGTFGQFVTGFVTN